MKIRKEWLFLFADAILSIIAYYIAMWLRFDGNISQFYLETLKFNMPIAAASVSLFGVIIGSYRPVLQYFGFADAFRQLLTCLCSMGTFFSFKYLMLWNISGSITIIYFGLVFAFTIGIRLCPRFAHWLLIKKSGNMQRTIIIGAGATGAMVIKRLQESIDDDLIPSIAVDDDGKKVGMRAAGIPIVGTLDEIGSLLKKYKIQVAILAIPSIESDKLTKLHQECIKAKVELKVFRNSIAIQEFIAGNRKVLKPISLEDLLFRESIKLDKDLIFQCLNEKVVLVTGGAGSIGSEICRQVLEHGCKKLIIFDINENGLFEINEELKKRYPRDKYELCLGSIRDVKRLDCVFGIYKPDLVFHAAAHKHVPMMEVNPFEAIKNNVIGSENVFHSCIKYCAEKCVLISTDKAVNPTSVMGATKRAAELLAQCLNGQGCMFTSVRFGNVLGSNGSVIPIFEKQIKVGGPVTVTHRDIERYFITIPEAVSLVMIAATMAEGGEIFVLDMGKPIRIYDLACEMIRLSGYVPEKEIKIEITGLRPGEKMYEEIFFEKEKVRKTEQEKIFVMEHQSINTEEFYSKLSYIKELSYTGTEQKRLKTELMEAIDL